MSDRESPRPFQVTRQSRGTRQAESLLLLGEEPLLIRIDDRPYSVVMRTPGEELFHAAGFCLGEGIVDSADDFRSTGYDAHQDPNVVDVWLRPERREKVKDLLGRRSFLSQTSCGICGKEMIRDLCQRLSPAQEGFEIGADRLLACIDELSRHQRHYRTTRSSHAALLLDDRLEEIGFGEDVGRHNALDKAIGKAMLSGRLPQARIAVLSSRNSYELVQKAARARLPVVLSNSRPTAMAVDMGRVLGMTLAFPAGEAELIIVSGVQRVR